MADKLVYFTDGSASPNPGPGGFAVIHNNEPVVLGSEPSGDKTTNIRMEGYALMAALRHAEGRPCVVYTDSEFWINVVTKWSVVWKKNGWKKKGGPIANLDIVQPLRDLYERSPEATLTWVRGHADNAGNILADEWANKAREQHIAHKAEGSA